MRTKPKAAPSIDLSPWARREIAEALLALGNMDNVNPYIYRRTVNGRTDDDDVYLVTSIKRRVQEGREWFIAEFERGALIGL